MPFDKLVTWAGRGAAALVLVALAFVARDEITTRATASASAAAAALVRDSIEAAADTTRAIHADVDLLGDSLRAVERRAVQAELKADAFDRTLRTQRVVHDELRATIESLERQVQSRAPVTDSADVVRRATFSVRDAPYTVRAEASLPRPPQAATLSLHVDLDTLGLSLSVACGEPDAAGIRHATTRVIAPMWAAVRLTEVAQSPAVCATTSRASTSGFAGSLRRAAARLSLSLGYGATRAPSGTVVAGPGAMFGIRVWP